VNGSPGAKCHLVAIMGGVGTASGAKPCVTPGNCAPSSVLGTEYITRTYILCGIPVDRTLRENYNAPMYSSDVLDFSLFLYWKCLVDMWTSKISYKRRLKG
jgi:hypothetical protein